MYNNALEVVSKDNMCEFANKRFLSFVTYNNRWDLCVIIVSGIQKEALDSIYHIKEDIEKVQACCERSHLTGKGNKIYDTWYSWLHVRLTWSS